jgi:hypothetical protein
VYDPRAWFVEWEGVMTYKFKIGEIVFLRPSFNQNIPGGAYIVIKRLPEYHGEFEYRVRNSYELHEHVVRENELKKAS